MLQNPRGAVVVFVKTPGLSPLKTRLAEGIGKDRAEAFFKLSCEAMTAVIQHAVQKVKPIELTPYWAVAEPSGTTYPLWQSFNQVVQKSGDLGDRLHGVYSELKTKYDFVILLGADSPQISSKMIIDATAAASDINHPRFVMGPAEDGGFYLFAGNQPIDEGVWTSVPYSDWQTAEKLRAQVSKIAPIKLLPQVFDVDTVEELTRLKSLLGSRHDLLPAQESLRTWIMESNY